VSTGMNNSTTSLDSTVQSPTFQGFQATTDNSFAGYDPNASFIGRQIPEYGRSTSTSSMRTTPTGTTRRVTTSRNTGRNTLGVSGMNTAGSRSVRAATSSSFDFSPFEVNDRAIGFQTRLNRLSLPSIVPENIDVKIMQTPTGNTATLSGTVPTTKDRRVMEMLLRLEPGIDRIQNNLQVDSPKL
ncbi:MAG: BON domain-containing protein, partial [Thermoguttaceae bacterium]